MTTIILKQIVGSLLTVNDFVADWRWENRWERAALDRLWWLKPLGLTRRNPTNLSLWLSRCSKV